jgi:signal transduction histidine kinase
MTTVMSIAAPLSVNEPQRLQALASYDILDTPFEGDFDDIARMAAMICDAPIAVVNLIDQGRQWFKAEVGLGVRETPIDSSICAYAILQPELFEVADTLLDPRFVGNPLVTGDPHLRFYAGAPLKTPDGYQLGTVCVLGYQPRQLDARQREALLALSRQTMALMELRRAVRAAEAAQKQLRRLVTTAGHDLRQPLQLISLNMEMARHRASDPANVVKYTTAGLSAAERMGSDLDVLAVAGASMAHLVDPEKIPLALRERFDSLQRMWTPHAERKGLRLRFAPSSARVMSNPHLLDTILGNLIGNAIKYTDRGSVLVGCRRQQEQVRIEVVDTGVGISSEQQASMFEAFRKVDVRSDGLGLGLSIVRNTADLLGVPVEMRSMPGRGTKVSLTVPLAS